MAKEIILNADKDLPVNVHCNTIRGKEQLKQCLTIEQWSNKRTISP